MLDLSVVIVNFNTKELTLKCLKSIFDKKWEIDSEVFLVDNASTDDTVLSVKKRYPQVSITLSDTNIGFAGANNLALKQSKARYSMLLNSDTEVYEHSLDNLVKFMDQTNFGIGSCFLVSNDETFQPNAGDLPFGLALLTWISGLDDILFFLKGKLPSYHYQFQEYYQKTREVGWVSGSVMIIKKEVMEKIGVLDGSIFMYGEDTEYCLRAKKAGFKIGWTDQAKIKHLGGGSSSNPHLKQWVGEFKGLLYIYKKYYGSICEYFLKVIMYIFIIFRMVAFLFIGKFQVARTYAKVIFSI